MADRTMQRSTALVWAAGYLFSSPVMAWISSQNVVTFPVTMKGTTEPVSWITPDYTAEISKWQDRCRAIVTSCPGGLDNISCVSSWCAATSTTKPCDENCCSISYTGIITADSMTAEWLTGSLSAVQSCMRSQLSTSKLPQSADPDIFQTIPANALATISPAYRACMTLRVQSASSYYIPGCDQIVGVESCQCWRGPSTYWGQEYNSLRGQCSSFWQTSSPSDTGMASLYDTSSNCPDTSSVDSESAAMSSYTFSDYIFTSVSYGPFMFDTTDQAKLAFPFVVPPATWPSSPLATTPADDKKVVSQETSISPASVASASAPTSTSGASTLKLDGAVASMMLLTFWSFIP